jgi:hypothetical protein
MAKANTAIFVVFAFGFQLLAFGSLPLIHTRIHINLRNIQIAVIV